MSQEERRTSSSGQHKSSIVRLRVPTAAAAGSTSLPVQQQQRHPIKANFDLPLYFGFACAEEATLETWAADDLFQLQSELDAMRGTMRLVTNSSSPPQDSSRKADGGVQQSPELQVRPGKTSGRGVVSGTVKQHDQDESVEETQIEVDSVKQKGTAPAEDEDDEEYAESGGEEMYDGAPSTSASGKKTSRSGRKSEPARKQTQPLQTPSHSQVKADPAASKSAEKAASSKIKGRRKKRARDSDEDAEGKKGGSSGGVTYAMNFWPTMETYLRPMQTKDLELLEPITEQQVQELCVIPPLGKHYLKVWAEEDAELAEKRLQESVGEFDDYPRPEPTPLQPLHSSSHTSRHATRQSTAARDGAEDSDGETVIDLTQRLMAAVLECPGDTQRLPPVVSLEDEDPVAHRAAVDASIKEELVALRLFQAGETVSSKTTAKAFPTLLRGFNTSLCSKKKNLPPQRDPSQDEDDELCRDLRALFVFYSNHIQALNAKREHLYKRALECCREGESRERERIAARQDLEAYSKLAKRPPSKRPGKGPQ